MNEAEGITMPKAFCMIGVIVLALSAFPSSGELIDRVVGSVDDRAITLSELDETYEKTKEVQPDISRSEVLTTMINRLLILNDAKRLKMEAATDDELINQYIELKVKALIRIKEEEIRDFYDKNTEEFKGAPYDSVRDKIEEILTEKETNARLKKQIAELRSKAYVQILE
ncbi:MAG TPA: hypothetical protein VEI96_04520 [Thermodesulfovibrionales bacterium]|nr:hypothetical protein [Thermodesulfovibrionales bacterium]